ncbi:MAG: DNA methylase [Planctomycetes bacterium]|nr:DNA methylase [Planctomycetota bacterium]
MAQSPSHKFGQIIGELLEQAIELPLQEVADDYGLYLDRKHPRRARGGKRKVAWTDNKGNVHDLDYVIEEGGSETVQGRPRAFIETAWRRYTKHSRNKSQEIQGAIVPLAETYAESHPFLGVVLAGDFTRGSLTQLRSHGFQILYYPYETIIEAFAIANIDAHFDEGTPDADLQEKVDAFEALSESRKQQIAKKLRDLMQRELALFVGSLKETLERSVKRVRIVPLHGSPHDLASIDDAVAFIEAFDEASSNNPFVRYELDVLYTNGDAIRGEFRDKADAIRFLSALS